MRNKKMQEELVSVIIPTYNCGNYIEQAIKSVLKQSVKTEIIIIDDASTDDTERKIDRYRKKGIVYYRKNKKRQGVSQSRNRGVTMAKGEYIAFLDADDWWDFCKLEKQLDCIRKNKSILCYTGRELYTEDGSKTGKKIEVKEKLTYRELLHHNSIACSSVLIRAEIAKEFPMEHDEVHEDYLTWLRILKKYKKACGINEPLLKTRLTLEGKSRNKWKTFPMTYGVFRYLGMKRLQALYYMGNHIIRSGIKYL